MMCRQGGGSMSQAVAVRKGAPPRRLVVDVREFMSSLPAVLHRQGLQLVPVTLEVPPSSPSLFRVIAYHKCCANRTVESKFCSVLQ